MSHVGHWPSACSVETIRTIGTKSQQRTGEKDADGAGAVVQEGGAVFAFVWCRVYEWWWVRDMDGW